MNTRIYEYMLAVAEQKNITKAAEQCFVSQPALTQHIKKLESQFGFPLFEKNGKNLVPTRQGEIFLTTARRMLQIEKETLTSIENLKKTTPQCYRIFTDISMRNLLIEQIWPKFQSYYPNLKLSLLSGSGDDAWEYLGNKIVDIAIFPFHGSIPSGMDCVSIEKSEYMLLLPASHPAVPLFSEYGTDLQKLSGETFILNQSYTFFNSLQQKILDYYHILPGKTLYSHSMSSIPNMVGSGLGVSFFPANLLPLVQTNCVPFSFTPTWFFQYVVAYRKSRGLNECDSLLAQFFIQHHSKFQNLF